VKGFEPPTTGFGDRDSSQLSYTPKSVPEACRPMPDDQVPDYGCSSLVTLGYCGPHRIRTGDPRHAMAMLYQAELAALVIIVFFPARLKSEPFFSGGIPFRGEPEWHLLQALEIFRTHTMKRAHFAPGSLVPPPLVANIDRRATAVIRPV
jgi:hypothetical protein